MKIRKTFNLACPLFFACLMLSACASKPVLLSKSAIVPAGVDFSGLWQLRADPGSKPIPVGRSEPGIRLPSKKTTRNAARRSSKRSSGSAVHVFLETGESLKISQTADGLFISFDRAIVEEYRFGENRVVSVGPIEAQRVSGWEERVFVVETLDAEGAILSESWRLDAGGDVLVRDISVAEGSEEQFSVRQRFDRI
jgi:hypothetical protein